MTTKITSKVAFNGAIRQITFPGPAVKWADFSSQVRQAHGIRPNLPLTVTHRDADGDIVTLDSDGELQDILASTARVRFDVTVVADEPQPVAFQQTATDSKSTDGAFDQESGVLSQPADAARSAAEKGKAPEHESSSSSWAGSNPDAANKHPLEEFFAAVQFMREQVEANPEAFEQMEAFAKQVRG
ncbi:hypothetical protein BDK51DRAFT_40040 [Blyttiomyces helicus]|uniref:PB1 domain-containing protein n=1 Tax=Blyttiomyces helicus TaxID=388810 RepID=A0A4P9VTY9_9FUNG|nr:hypothetical protein BDK51DRAFT_40040 [Blyttiomyces helicus]|eukprot:RKO83019.1 hypothetical protein BDK51DRAFT_40040 [Blyttiomyces helicus]